VKQVQRLLITLLLIATAAGCGRVVTTPQPVNGTLETINGFYVLHVWGSPAEMGRAHGTLLKTQIANLIQGYLINGLVKDFGIPWAMIVQFARFYEAGMPEDFKAELHGIAEGAGIDYDEVLVGQLIVDLTALAVASATIESSSFLAKGGATSGEVVIHGANIEWADYNNALRDNLVIIYYEPSEGNKLVSLSYAGGAGVLIGMNEKHIATSVTAINAGASFEGIAMTANLRRMLQYSNNLSEAADNLISIDRTCGYTVPVSCGNPEGIFVMELSPKHFMKREAGTLEVLVSTNHFISEEMIPYQLITSDVNSTRRWETLSSLVMQNYGSITDSPAKSFMCDRSEPHGDFINSDYVIYSTVLLPGDLTFWVAKGPVSSEAAYVSFSL